MALSPVDTWPMAAELWLEESPEQIPNVWAPEGPLSSPDQGQSLLGVRAANENWKEEIQ